MVKDFQGDNSFFQSLWRYGMLLSLNLEQSEENYFLPILQCLIAGM